MSSAHSVTSVRAAPGPWAVLALFAAALALYWSSLGNPLVFDDARLTRDALQRMLEDGLGLGRRSLSNASFGWIYGALGPDWRWQRLANVLLHAAVAATLFLFLRRLFSRVLPEKAPANAWFAFLGAVLFLAHPVAVYGVAYLIQRSIVMATLFGLASLWLFLEGLVRTHWGWFLASAAAYLAAVLSKEHCVMLPALAAALAILVRGWPPRPLGGLALPFALYAAIGIGVTLQSRGLLGGSYETFAAAALRQAAEPGGAAAGALAYPLSIVNQGFLFFRYLLSWLAPWPGWLSVDLRPAFPSQLLAWPQAAGIAAWLAWPLAAGALLLRGGRAGLAGFAMLAPWLLGLTEFVTVRVQEMFVLYRSYLWMALLPAAIPAAFGRLQPRIALALLALAALALVVPFADRLRTFSSDVVLWDDAVRKIADPRAPYADRAYRNRGVAYYRLERYAEARRDFDRALELDPAGAKAWILRGTLFMRTAQSARALADFDRARALEPDNVELLARRCFVLMRLQRLDEALADCTRAAELGADDADNFTGLGMVRALRGEVAQAERHYLRALELDPASGAAHYQYGVLLRGTGRGGEAAARFRAACAAGLRAACEAARVP